MSMKKICNDNSDKRYFFCIWFDILVRFFPAILAIMVGFLYYYKSINDQLVNTNKYISRKNV